MAQGERRIRSLKLVGRDNGQLLQARYRLEEAFRTASFPGLPPNAQVVIRHLDLGTIDPRQSAPSLAARISELMRNLASQAVYVGHQHHSSARVVWFKDDLQVYQVLLANVLDDKSVTQWYWRCLFPNRCFELNPESIESLLLDSRHTKANRLGPAYLLDVCLEPSRLRRLFAWLTPVLARRLLHESGLTPVAAVVSDDKTHAYSVLSGRSRSMMIPAPSLNLKWRNALLQALSLWGGEDVRTLCLAYYALVFHQPAYLQHNDVLQRIVVCEWLRELGSHGLAAEAKHSSPGHALQTSGGSITLAEAGDKRTNEAGGDSREKSATILENGQAQEKSPATSAVETGPWADPGTNSESAFIPIADQHHIDTASAQQPAALTDNPLTFSSRAGFAFVISLLQRLGITELLDRNPALVAGDFPRQLLWLMAQRMGLAKHDPVWSLFEHHEPDARIEISEFMAPLIWWRIAQTSGRPLRRYCLAQPGQYLITDPSGRWLLFQGDQAACSGVDVKLHVDEAGVSLPSLTMIDVINSTQLVAAGYLRRFCAMSLRSLVRRPGKLVLTSTHWDVVFNLDQTDLRLRRVALDSNPDWVPWLGKVVQFHFDSEG